MERSTLPRISSHSQNGGYPAFVLELAGVLIKDTECTYCTRGRFPLSDGNK